MYFARRAARDDSEDDPVIDSPQAAWRASLRTLKNEAQAWAVVPDPGVVEDFADQLVWVDIIRQYREHAAQAHDAREQRAMTALINLFTLIPRVEAERELIRVMEGKTAADVAIETRSSRLLKLILSHLPKEELEKRKGVLLEKLKHALLEEADASEIRKIPEGAAVLWRRVEEPRKNYKSDVDAYFGVHEPGHLPRFQPRQLTRVAERRGVPDTLFLPKRLTSVDWVVESALHATLRCVLAALEVLQDRTDFALSIAYFSAQQAVLNCWPKNSDTTFPQIWPKAYLRSKSAQYDPSADGAFVQLEPGTAAESFQINVPSPSPINDISQQSSERASLVKKGSAYAALEAMHPKACVMQAVAHLGPQVHQGSDGAQLLVSHR